MNKSWLKIGYWNIKGLKCNDQGLKTEDDDVLNIILNHDIMCLTEVHCGDSDIPKIDGYDCFKMCRGLNKRINRYFGGIAIYYRSCIRKGIKFLRTDTDFVWLKLCKHFFGLKKDIYLCLIYIPPESSPYYKTRGLDSLALIEEEIVKVNNEGSVILMGDLNARTSNVLDYIKDDNDFGIEDMSWYTVDNISIDRVSEDNISPCTRGKKLLDLCKSTRLRILNGRILGDSFGSYTCFQHNGSSVVDYLITNEDNIHNIAYFQVCDFVGTASDHCCLSTGLRLNNVLVRSNVKTTGSLCPPKYVWNRNCIEDYQSAFTLDNIKNLIVEANNMNCNFTRESVNNMVDKFSDIYVRAADLSLKKVIPKNCKAIRKKNKKWFSEDLVSLKKHVLFLSGQLKKYPNVPEIRGSFFKTLKQYNKIRKKKCRQFKQKMLDKLDALKVNDPKSYWNLLNTLKSKTEECDNIDIIEWKSYFTELNRKTSDDLGERRQTIIKDLAELEKSKCFNELSFRFSENEISKCIKQLKCGKSSGMDSISNEMIKYSQHAMLPSLVKLFNNILLSGMYPQKWCNGYIVPIFKSGDNSMPTNYRGITIFSCLAKLFNVVINNRIEKFLEENKLIDIRQIGFKQKCRTSDHMFILRTLIEKYTKKGGKLYACFIDFRKAFDKIDHTYLLYKMLKMGISGNMFNLFKDMYLVQGLQTCVKVNNYLSSMFKSEVGVRQGDPVSPNLFKMYINDIAEYLFTNADTPSINDVNIGHLMYADDIILLACNEKDLQKSVQGVQKFCSDWDLQVNTDKSKILVFNKGGKLLNAEIVYQNIKLENVMCYKYLGIQFHASGKFDIARQDLLDRSLKALYKLMGCFKELNKPSFSTCMHLFDHVVKPVLIYGADICGFKISKYASLYNEMKKDVFEKCHMKYLRFVLGVNKHATIIGLYGETGRFPLYVSNISMFIKYWHRLAQFSNSEGLLYNAFNYNKESESSWWKSVKKLSNMANIDINQARERSVNFFLKAVVDVCKTSFMEGWKDELNCDDRAKDVGGNKLRCYREFKHQFRVEPYLNNCKNFIFRSNICKLRISCHKLHIEMGRYQKGSNRLKPEERICQQCNMNEIEDEFHFLLRCSLLDNERSECFSGIKLKYPTFDTLAPKEKFLFLMSMAESEVLHEVGLYITAGFKKRS